MGRPSIMIGRQKIDTSFKKVPQLRCDVEGCGKYFSKLSRLKYHQNTHLKDKPYKCTHQGCTSAYFRPNHLKRHVKSTHETSNELVKDFRCLEEGCGAAFESQRSLYYHTKRKHSNQPHQCSLCEKKFGKKWMLKEHEAGHTGNSPFKCEEEGCDMEFKDYKQFKAHKRSHEKKSNTETKILKCSIGDCVEEFLKWSELVNHRKSCHPKEAECPICRKTFTKGNLKVHLQVHKDDVDRTALLCPFEGCPRFYFHQKNLNHHMRVKHHDQGFKCPTCERKLSSKQKLQEHIKKKHQNEGLVKKRRLLHKSDATSLLSKLAPMSNADWDTIRPGPPRFARQKYDFIKFPNAKPNPGMEAQDEEFRDSQHGNEKSIT